MEAGGGSEEDVAHKNIDIRVVYVTTAMYLKCYLRDYNLHAFG